MESPWPRRQGRHHPLCGVEAMFIAFRIDGFDPDHTTPIAIEDTKDAAQTRAIQRVLSIADVYCEIRVQSADVNNLTPGKIETLKATVDKFWSDRGVTV